MKGSKIAGGYFAALFISYAPSEALSTPLSPEAGAVGALPPMEYLPGADLLAEQPTSIPRYLFADLTDEGTGTSYLSVRTDKFILLIDKQSGSVVTRISRNDFASADMLFNRIYKTPLVVSLTDVSSVHDEKHDLLGADSQLMQSRSLSSYAFSSGETAPKLSTFSDDAQKRIAHCADQAELDRAEAMDAAIMNDDKAVESYLSSHGTKPQDMINETAKFKAQARQDLDVKIRQEDKQRRENWAKDPDVSKLQEPIFAYSRVPEAKPESVRVLPPLPPPVESKSPFSNFIERLANSPIKPFYKGNGPENKGTMIGIEYSKKTR